MTSDAGMLVMETVSLHSISHPNGKIPIGQSARFVLSGYEGHYDCFLKQNHTLYLDPVKSNSGNEIVIFPESPGFYSLLVCYDLPSGKAGWIETHFHVIADISRVAGPQLEDRETSKIWYPNAWEAALGAEYEPALMTMIKDLIRPGAIIYDIGANIGLYTIRFAKLAGPNGWVYCFEPNPIAAHFMISNMAANNIHNLTLLPAAISNVAKSVEFTINFGSSLLGIGSDAVFASSKCGYRINVPAHSLDDLVTRFQLRKPDVIKIDIEGAEVSAVAGMLRTLEKHRPVLIIELHGRGAAEGTLSQLARLCYSWQVAGESEAFTAEDLASRCPDACLQVIGQRT